MAALGVDISEFNGDFNLQKGTGFVIIRAGDGDYWDARVQQNIDKAIRENVPYGLYWLIRDWKIANAEATASELCRFADKQKVRPSVGIWCDVEDEYDQDPSEAIPYVNAFCGTVEDCGYYAGIYCNYWYHDHLYPALSKYDCWIADWDEDPETDPEVGTMKQYSTTDGVLDRNVCFVPLSTYQIIKDEKPLTLEQRVKILEDKIKELERKLSK